MHSVLGHNHSMGGSGQADDRDQTLQVLGWAMPHLLFHVLCESIKACRLEG